MKTLSILLILLVVTACTWLQATPTASPTPVCACPTAVSDSTQSQGSDAVHAPVICNCPIILVTPVSTTQVELTSQANPPDGITLADSGKVFSLHPGDSFLFDLGIAMYDWTVAIDNPTVLGKVNNVAVIRGAQGVYTALSPGQATLTAIGNPTCRNSIPACGAPSVFFRITIVVQ